MTEPKEVPANNGDERSGEEWLDDLLQAQAKVQFELAWMGFMVGQMGAAMHYEAPFAELDDFIAQCKQNVIDTRDRIAGYLTVCDGMIANAERSLAAAKEKGESEL